MICRQLTNRGTNYALNSQGINVASFRHAHIGCQLLPQPNKRNFTVNYYFITDTQQIEVV